MRVVIMALIAAALTVSGCDSGSDGGGRSATESPRSTEDFEAAAARAVEAVLLTQADLPDEYTPEPEGEDDGVPDPGFSFTGQCAEFNQYFNTGDGEWLGSVAEADSGDFEGDRVQSISSSAAAFRDAETAQNELDAFERFFATCESQFSAAFADFFEQYARDDLGVDIDVTVTFADLRVAARGDSTLATRMVMSWVQEGLPIGFNVDSITVRSGRMIASVEYSYGGSERDTALLERLTGVVASRAEEQDAQLPR